MSLLVPPTPTPPRQFKLAGYLNLTEFKNVLTSSVVMGALLSVLVVVLQAVNANLNAILPNPAIAFIVGHFLTLTIGSLQQMGHGFMPAVPNPPIPAPTQPHQVIED